MSARKASGSGRPAAVAGVPITHPDRVMYPDEGITKLELAVYYDRVADLVLPHVVNRPLSIVRCPEGLDPGAAVQGIHQTYRGARVTRCFFQKHASRGTAGLVKTVRAPEHAGSADYLAVFDRRDLLSLIQLGTLELHPWGARAD